MRSGLISCVASWDEVVSRVSFWPSRPTSKIAWSCSSYRRECTREPWLLARVRHAHIVEIVSHAWVDDDAFQMICMPFWGGATLAAVLAARRETGRRPASGLDLLADLDSVAAPNFRPFRRRDRLAKYSLASLTARRSRGSVPGWPRLLTTRSVATWLTATSSLPTSCCPPMATRCCSISTWPATGRRPA